VTRSAASKVRRAPAIGGPNVENPADRQDNLNFGKNGKDVMGLLDNKVVLVTGGGRGIGRDVAILSARQGAKVVVNDLGGGIHGEGSDKTPAQEVVDTIRSEGGHAVANFDSVTDLAAVARMAQQAMDAFGGLHIVQNPAGFLRDRMLHNMTEEEWDGTIQVHLRGHFNVVRATIGHFRSQQEGAYVLWSSTSGLIGNVGQTNYGAAKMGVAGLSRIVALEGERNNVRSNCIAPGAATRLTDSVPRTDPEAIARRERQRQIQSPERPAQLAVALSAPASASVSGQVFAAVGYDLAIFQQPRPIETYRHDGGWDADLIIEEFLPRIQKHLTPLSETAIAPPQGKLTLVP
jgi:NAD(P)-dependent dehydrogenase (short-subunit alcohol dehydrogenase family)